MASLYYRSGVNWFFSLFITACGFFFLSFNWLIVFLDCCISAISIRNGCRIAPKSKQIELKALNMVFLLKWKFHIHPSAAAGKCKCPSSQSSQRKLNSDHGLKVDKNNKRFKVCSTPFFEKIFQTNFHLNSRPGRRRRDQLIISQWLDRLKSNSI